MSAILSRPQCFNVIHEACGWSTVQTIGMADALVEIQLKGTMNYELQMLTR